MKRMRVDTDSIGAAGKAAANELKVLEKAVADMDKSVVELNAVWKGGNHDVFAKTYAERRRQIQKAQKQLQDYLRCLATVNKKYEQCESDVSGLASF